VDMERAAVQKPLIFSTSALPSIPDRHAIAILVAFELHSECVAELIENIFWKNRFST